jgi:5-methylcytosine-specific restriction protein A
MKKYICRSPGCSALLDEPGYCAKHKRKPEDKPKAFETANRFNENLYNTSRWKKLRKEHLKDNACCAACGSSSGLAIDHIVRPLGNEELFFNPGNLQTLCASCHRLKTAMEINERRKIRQGRF